MYPHTDGPLRAMPIDTKAQAIEFVQAYKDWLEANRATGMGAFLLAKGKPATVRAPDLVEKARIAYERAELNYWQMPYEDARRRHWNLPESKWIEARLSRDLPV